MGRMGVCLHWGEFLGYGWSMVYAVHGCDHIFEGICWVALKTAGS